ncbi:transmembrane protein, putative, partial [Bodo saltans]
SRTALRNMQLSTKSKVTAAVHMQAYNTPSFSVRGTDNFFAIGGSQPVLVFNITDNGTLNFYGSVNVGGVIIGMAAPVSGSVDIWTVDNSTAASSLKRKRVYFTNISDVILVSALVDTAADFNVARRHQHELAAFTGYASRFVFDATTKILVSFFNNGTNISTVSITSLSTGVTTTMNITITKLIWVQVDKAGELVTLSGSTYGGLWEADVFSVDPSTGVASFFLELSNATRSVDICGNTTNRCTAATMCAYFSSRNQMYCVLRRQADGAIYAAFSMDNISTSSLTSLVLYSVGSDEFNVTATVEDPYFGIAVIGINFAGSSSEILQINGTTPATILSMIDPPVSSVVAIVSSMFIDLPNRILYAVRQAEFTATMYQINLFGVTDITPDILDSAGDTPVIIHGYGFGPLQPLQCNFGRSLVSNATVIDNYTIACNTTVEEISGNGCTVLYFNLISGTRSTDATNTPITRIAGVTLDYAVDGDGLIGYTAVEAATTITLVGFGFVSSEWARCRMVDANGTVLQDLNPVTFIGGNSATCTMPEIANPTVPPTYIEYSHDGTIYSPSRAEFAVVGAAYDIVGGFEDAATGDLVDDETLITVTVTSLTQVPTLIGFLVDKYGNRRGALETTSTAYQITTAVNTGDPETLTFANASIQRVAMVDGVVTFDSVILALPIIGTYTLYMKSLVYTGLEASATFTILPGAPYRVAMTNVSRMLTVWTIPVTSATILQPSPVVVIVDVAGNSITNLSNLPAQVVLQYANAYENATTGDVYYRTVSAAAQPDEAGEYTFSSVSVQTVYDSSFVMSFQASVEYGNSPIGSYLTPIITTATCVPGAEYAIAGTFTCLPCPEFGVCDGSSTVTPLSGYWRSSLDSFIFYSCAPPDGANSCGNGVASCDEGYAGPRCSSCAVGYGKSGSSCAACLDNAFNWGISWLIFFVVVGVSAFLVIRSIMDVSEGVTPEKTVIVLKSLVTHAQVLGALVALLDVNDMPGFFSQFFQAGGQAKINVNLSFFSCAIAHDALDSYIFSLVIPWLLCAFVAMIVLSRGTVLYYLGYRVEALKVAYREKRHKARAKKSMFHKSSESYDILASMGAQHIDVRNMDSADDDVDPHEIAI